MRLVLEADGTHVDDSGYLDWLPDNSTFLLLRHGEHWTRPGRAPARDEPPREAARPGQGAPSQAPGASPIPRVVCEALNLLEIRHEPPFWKIIDNRGRITLVLHWETGPGCRVRCVEPVPTPPDAVTVTSDGGKVVTTMPGRRAREKRPERRCPGHRADECEFHCGSLHEEGRSIADSGRSRGAAAAATVSRSGHVRFVEQEAKKRQMDSSESELEPEAGAADEGGVTTEKTLLLTDQLTAEQRRHLTILDLGVILDRLKAKIVDVERLEREREGPSCYRWLIRATIRGRALRDLGILYNGNYYSISEEPGLAFAASGFEDDEDREDPV